MLMKTPEEAIATVAIMTKSAQSPERLSFMAGALRRLDERGIEGDVVECGIWQGGYLILARMLSPDRLCWGYDTFTGMTEPGAFDVTRGGRKGKAGKSAASMETVIANFERTGTYDPHRLRLIKGPVESTLTEAENRPDKIALLRLDTDWYASTKAELDHLWPLLVPGGVLIVDDYGHWMGARRAVTEYFGNNMPGFSMVDYTCMLMVKPW